MSSEPLNTASSRISAGPSLHCPFDLDMELLAQRLQQLRKSRGLTQASLARILGVSPRVYNRWEKAAAVPRLHTLVQIADTLQVSLDELTGRQDPSDNGPKVRNQKLHRLYRYVDQLSDEDQKALIVLLDSLVKRSQMARLVSA